jgi:hypothetical protein
MHAGVLVAAGRRRISRSGPASTSAGRRSGPASTSDNYVYALSLLSVFIGSNHLCNGWEAAPASNRLEVPFKSYAGGIYILSIGCKVFKHPGCLNLARIKASRVPFFEEISVLSVF